MFGDIGGCARAAGWVEHEIAGVRCHQDTALYGIDFLWAVDRHSRIVQLPPTQRAECRLIFSSPLAARVTIRCWGAFAAMPNTIFSRFIMRVHWDLVRRMRILPLRRHCAIGGWPLTKGVGHGC
jgi:hypothetical protein